MGVREHWLGDMEQVYVQIKDKVAKGVSNRYEGNYPHSLINLQRIKKRLIQRSQNQWYRLDTLYWKLHQWNTKVKNYKEVTLTQGKDFGYIFGALSRKIPQKTMMWWVSGPMINEENTKW